MRREKSPWCGRAEGPATAALRGERSSGELDSREKLAPGGRLWGAESEIKITEIRSLIVGRVIEFRRGSVIKTRCKEGNPPPMSKEGDGHHRG